MVEKRKQDEAGYYSCNGFLDFHFRLPKLNMRVRFPLPAPKQKHLLSQVLLFWKPQAYFHARRKAIPPAPRFCQRQNTCTAQKRRPTVWGPMFYPYLSYFDYPKKEARRTSCLFRFYASGARYRPRMHLNLQPKSARGACQWQAPGASIGSPQPEQRSNYTLRMQLWNAFQGLPFQ